MKERPILMKPEMVAAILGGRKTQTRRVLKPQPADRATPADWDANRMNGEMSLWADSASEQRGDVLLWSPEDSVYAQRCPYGQVGDRLWVREQFGQREWSIPKYSSSIPIVYRADGAGKLAEGLLHGMKWKPSIHMPKWACRLRLEITEFRVERLQAITGADALAETGRRRDDLLAFEDQWEAYIRMEFGYLWDSINGKGSWESNPWVWVVGFKVVKE